MTEAHSEPTLAGLRRSVARLLPEAMERALGSYRRFAEVDVSLITKEFKEHHQAGRVALAHLDALLKLANWASGDENADAAGRVQAEVEAMIGEAQRALATLRGSAQITDDDDL
ncbi:conserved hypothetical protein [uncultured Gammaproteobacteria bacterium]